MAFKLKHRVQFPANVTVTAPLTMVKTGLAYQLGVDPTLGALGPTGPGYGGTSTTSLAIATGSKTFTTQSGYAYQAGNYIRASSAADGTNYMEGTITSYAGTSLVVGVTKVGGSGTKTDWTFSLAGTPGANGAGSGDLLAANNGSDFSNKKTTKDNISVHGADVASATTTNLETATGDLVDVTGTTTITAITLNEGHERTVRFTGALTLTHGASLVLPGSANITTAAGDFAIFRGYAASVVRCVSYSKLTPSTPLSTVTGLGTGVATFLGTPSSANLRSALTDETGTGSAVFATTPTITTPNIIGVSDGSSAAAGSASESFQQDLLVGSAITLGGSIANVTSKSVAAGRWLIWGNVIFSAQGTTAYSEVHASTSLTSGAVESINSNALHVTFITGQTAIIPCPPRFLNVGTATTVYLTCACTVTGGSAMLAYGSLFGVRLP